jgi:hypothetical protein
MPVIVITHGQPFPGPFAVLEEGWREGQEKLAALSTNSLLIVAEKANHMIHLEEPSVVLDGKERGHCSASRRKPEEPRVSLLEHRPE